MRGIILLGLAAGLQIPALYAGTVTQPCSAGVAAENIIPVSNGITTYCISDFGWSDSWLLGKPVVYSETLDMFSGDDAFNLYYNAPSGGTGAGTGWLSPSMDQGTLKAQTIPSNWQVITAVHSTGAASAESVIGNADGLRITIDTTSIGSGVTIGLTIQNTSISAITGLELADYFNFHPNGSAAPNNLDGTTSIQSGCVVTTGVQDPTFLMNGFMCGLRAPDHFEVGLDNGPNAVWRDVQNRSYNGSVGPIGPGATAGALEWNLGTLAPGAQIFFAIGKNTIPTDQSGGGTPEPNTIFLAGSAAAAIALARYRRRK